MVDLADGKLRESRIDDRGQEFPRVDERVVGKRHRYGYAPMVEEGTDGGATLLKHDLVGDDSVSGSFGSDKALGEFVFHPSSPTAGEDVANIGLPHRVPAGFHGNWVPASA